MGGCDQVDVVGTLGLKAEKDMAKLLTGHLLSKALLADLVILAEAAA